MGKFKSVLIFFCMVSLVGGAGAETITKPHNFTSGTTIRSSKVNENFDVIFQELNRLRVALEACQCGGSLSLSEGLVAYYPFNGNANDESGNGNNGTVNGAMLTEDRFGNADSAYSFDGVDDYIEILDSSSLSQFNNKITISFWMKISEFPTNAGHEFYLLGKMYNNYPNIQGFHIALSTYPENNPSNSLFFRATDSTNWGDWHIGGGVPFADIPTNQYIHIIFMYGGNGTEIYINGQLHTANDDLDGRIGNNNESLTIGFDGWDTTSKYYKGNIDDLRIYNRGLSDSEIRELYNIDNP